MIKKRIDSLKKEIRNTLNQYLSDIDNDFILTGALSRAVEQSVRLQVYLELENKNVTSRQ